VHLSEGDKVRARPHGMGIGLQAPASVRLISGPANSPVADSEEGSAKGKGKSKSSKSEAEWGAGSIVELDFGTVRPQRYEALVAYSPALYALGVVSAPTLIPSNSATSVKVVIQLFEKFVLPEDDALVTIYLID